MTAVAPRLDCGSSTSYDEVLASLVGHPASATRRRPPPGQRFPAAIVAGFGQWCAPARHPSPPTPRPHQLPVPTNSPSPPTPRPHKLPLPTNSPTPPTPRPPPIPCRIGGLAGCCSPAASPPPPALSVPVLSTP